MRSNAEIAKNPAIHVEVRTYDTMVGDVQLPSGLAPFIMGRDEEGWEHVSISPYGPAGEAHTPSWDDMAFIKSIFWKDSEEVLELHPAESEYVNLMENCLHLWKPIGIQPMEALAHMIRAAQKEVIRGEAG